MQPYIFTQCFWRVCNYVFSLHSFRHPLIAFKHAHALYIYATEMAPINSESFFHSTIDFSGCTHAAALPPASCCFRRHCLCILRIMTRFIMRLCEDAP